MEHGYSVHILPLGENESPNEENLLFQCEKDDGHIEEHFNRFGCELLSKCHEKNLVIMDELGPHEAQAILLRSAVLKMLDSNASVFGILQVPAESFWPETVNYPMVEIIEVQENNRDSEMMMVLSRVMRKFVCRL